MFPVRARLSYFMIRIDRLQVDSNWRPSMTDLTLHRLLNRVLYASLAATGVLLSCGGTGSELPETSLFAAPPCTPSQQISVAGLLPTSPVDYVELRRSSFGGTSDSTVSSSGTKCGTATDMMTCNNDLTSLTSTDGFHGGCLPGSCAHYLATTSGDTVAKVVSVAELKSFLANVDTPSEAVLTAFANDYDLSCKDPERGGVRVSPSGVGYEVLASKMTRDCDPVEITGYHLHVRKSGAVSVLASAVISSQKGVCVGRRPVGLIDGAPDGCDMTGDVGEYLARSAELEAAAVAAFEILGRELQAHGAPVDLSREATWAAQDEVRHARLTAQLAHRYGAIPKAPRVEPRGVRELFDVAMENAVEGCVRETYGALVALWQARVARDPVVATAMSDIAADEIRHAALSWSVSRWANRVLPERPRQRLRQAQQQAIATLRDEVAAAPKDSLTHLLGLPTPAQAQTMLDQLEASLWQTA
jgi:hypothetical protein